jgi:hypothetical protein
MPKIEVYVRKKWHCQFFSWFSCVICLENCLDKVAKQYTRGEDEKVFLWLDLIKLNCIYRCFMSMWLYSMYDYIPCLFWIFEGLPEVALKRIYVRCVMLWSINWEGVQRRCRHKIHCYKSYSKWSSPLESCSSRNSSMQEISSDLWSKNFYRIIP